MTVTGVVQTIEAAAEVRASALLSTSATPPLPLSSADNGEYLRANSVAFRWLQDPLITRWRNLEERSPLPQYSLKLITLPGFALAAAIATVEGVVRLSFGIVSWVFTAVFRRDALATSDPFAGFKASLLVLFKSFASVTLRYTVVHSPPPTLIDLLGPRNQMNMRAVQETTPHNPDGGAAESGVSSAAEDLPETTPLHVEGSLSELPTSPLPTCPHEAEERTTPPPSPPQNPLLPPPISSPLSFANLPERGATAIRAEDQRELTPASSSHPALFSAATARAATPQQDQLLRQPSPGDSSSQPRSPLERAPMSSVRAPSPGVTEGSLADDELNLQARPARRSLSEIAHRESTVCHRHVGAQQPERERRPSSNRSGRAAHIRTAWLFSTAGSTSLPRPPLSPSSFPRTAPVSGSLTHHDNDLTTELDPTGPEHFLAITLTSNDPLES